MASPACPAVRYPATARGIGLQGLVRVQITVNPQGEVTQAQLAKPPQLGIQSEHNPDPPAARRRIAALELERAALATARRCTLPPVGPHFTPATAVLPFNFDLE
ncbi:MAG: TonB family protein [Pseudomonadota bacterium]|nr:TonB family protein [Pseudomonadota bacterium]